MDEKKLYICGVKEEIKKRKKKKKKSREVHQEYFVIIEYLLS